MILDEDAFEDLDGKEWVKMGNKAVKKLPPRTKDLFWDLYGHPVLDPFSDRIDTNAFAIEIERSTQYGVFPEIAVRMNLHRSIPKEREGC